MRAMTPGDRTTENQLLETFARMLRGSSRTKGVAVGVGDDAAVIDPPANEQLLITTDGQVEGRHYQRGWLSATEIGWRLAAVNLSDIAAMGGRPRYAVVSLNLPPRPRAAFVTELERGVRDHLRKYGAVVVGGNVSATEKNLVADMTLIGSCAKGRAWRRTCTPGRDTIVVVGALGDARAGLQLLKEKKKRATALTRAFKRPVPRLDVARMLRNERAVHGAIDVSDGFATDVIRLCRAGAAGCEIDLSLLPTSRALDRFCKARGDAPQKWALHGGEDYALILSVDSAKAERLAERIERRLDVPTRVVGRFTRARGRYRLLRNGREVALKALGWDHFR